MLVKLDDLAADRRNGNPRGIVSVCSAHPLVLRAALRYGRETHTTVLVEATCNQVNHQGGYTGMKPQAFVELVTRLAEEENAPLDTVIFGGDHLGPNPWRHLPADQAMAEAEKMMAAFVGAGFTKIHLDASMGCAGEPLALDDHVTATRACRLAAVAEDAARKAGTPPPFYIIGTEVPPPGGADHALDDVPPSDPQAALETISVHRRAFEQAGLEEAFSRVCAIVVQPGVEFGNQNVVRYDRSRAQPLIRALDAHPDLVFEAHSTDYQGAQPLRELVEDGFAILKVGPELTFVLRETLYALDLIASDIDPQYPPRALMAAMEDLMLAQPEFWHRHYPADTGRARMLRHYSLSDRIRYYWPMETAEKAVARLFEALHGAAVPYPVLRQHLPDCTDLADFPFDPKQAVLRRLENTLGTYQQACRTITDPILHKEHDHVA